GEWTFEELPGSPPISRVEVNEPAPEPRVAARVRGRGAQRQLAWNSRSLGFQRQRLEFVERLGDGEKVVIARTRRASGKRTFKVHRGSHYGKRRLEVLVVHRHSPVMKKVLDRYRVQPPRRPARPPRVRAFRNGGRTIVRWADTARARSFLVRLKVRGTEAFYTREVSGNRNTVTFDDAPGRRPMVAIVNGLNRDGIAGPVRRIRLRGDSAAEIPAQAIHMALRTARLNRSGTAVIRSHCPAGGHCDYEFVLRRNGGRLLDRIEYQQAPDTRRRHRLFLSRKLRNRLARGQVADLRLRVKLTRGDRTRAGSTAFTPDRVP
ncbi:MAG: hypothetical protein KDB62_09240, partial [Solirubrobacterales bacterium]|nr:hypothetical protein [Solirubrobacterales bacterium]